MKHDETTVKKGGVDSVEDTLQWSWAWHPMKSWQVGVVTADSSLCTLKSPVLKWNWLKLLETYFVHVWDGFAWSISHHLILELRWKSRESIVQGLGRSRPCPSCKRLGQKLGEMLRGLLSRKVPRHRNDMCMCTNHRKGMWSSVSRGSWSLSVIYIYILFYII